MPERRCTARSKRSGDRCKRAPIPGGSVCIMHGGAAPQVRRAARERAAAEGNSRSGNRRLLRSGCAANAPLRRRGASRRRDDGAVRVPASLPPIGAEVATSPAVAARPARDERPSFVYAGHRWHLSEADVEDALRMLGDDTLAAYRRGELPRERAVAIAVDRGRRQVELRTRVLAHCYGIPTFD